MEGCVGRQEEGDDLLADYPGGLTGVAAVGQRPVQAGPVEVDDEVLAPGVVGDVSFFVASG